MYFLLQLTNQKNMIEIELKEKLGRRLEEINNKIEGLGGDLTLSQPTSNQLESGKNELSTLTRSVEENNVQLTSKYELVPLQLLYFQWPQS